MKAFRHPLPPRSIVIARMNSAKRDWRLEGRRVRMQVNRMTPDSDEQRQMERIAIGTGDEQSDHETENSESEGDRRMLV